MSAAHLRLVECRAICGGERDSFRIVWEEQATAKDRRLLLMMAGEPPQSAGRLAGRAWADLSAELRGNIKRGLSKFKAWAERLQ